MEAIRHTGVAEFDSKTIPFPDMPSTYADKKRDEEERSKQQQEAISKQILEQNLALREEGISC